MLCCVTVPSKYEGHKHERSEVDEIIFSVMELSRKLHCHKVVSVINFTSQ